MHSLSVSTRKRDTLRYETPPLAPELVRSLFRYKGSSTSAEKKPRGASEEPRSFRHDQMVMKLFDSDSHASGTERRALSGARSTPL